MKRIGLLFFVFYLIWQISYSQNAEQFPKIHFDEWGKMHNSKKATFDWFKNAKSGMSIHWGLYSIPGIQAPNTFDENLYNKAFLQMKELLQNLPD